jgi:hypothetical protein
MAYPNWETPLQGLIAQQQNPLTNLPTPVPQQAQPGFMDQLGSFAQSPQGQQALLAFANSALQNNMNPMMGGGAGFIGAMGSGMQGYKAADEYQDRKARQKKTEAHEDVMMPLEEQYMKGRVAGQGAVETANKLNATKIDYQEGPDKRVWAQKYKLTAISPDGKETWEPEGKPYRRTELPQPPQPRAPHMLTPQLVSWFQSPAGGARKDIRTYEDLIKLTPEESAKFHELVRKNPQLAGGLLTFLLNDQGSQQGQGYNVPEEEVK